MEEIKKYVIDYVEGKIESKAFLESLHNDSQVMEWLQSIVPKDKLGYYDDIVTREDGTWYQKTGPYCIKDVINSIWNRRGISFLENEMETFSVISRLMKEAFPDEEMQVDSTLEDKFRFILIACPEYLYSAEIENAGILESLIEEFPESMPKTKRIKAFRDKLKAMFYVEGQKYPRWIQESEWPLSKTGKPTKFLRQKSKGEVSFYYFLDVDTGEEIEIMQAY